MNRVFLKKSLQFLAAPKHIMKCLPIASKSIISKASAFRFSDIQDKVENLGNFVPKYTRSTSGKSFMTLDGNSKTITFDELQSMLKDKDVLSPFVKNTKLPLKFELINEGSARIVRALDEQNVDPSSEHDLFLYYNFCSVGYYIKREIISF